MLAQVFPTRVDRWIGALLLAALALATLNVYQLLTGPPISLGSFLFRFGAMLVPLLIAWPVRYVVGDDGIEIRGGLLLRRRIPFANIRSVTPSKNDGRAAVALSLDRLQIRHERNGREIDTLVSPRDQQGFLAALRNRGVALSAGEGKPHSA